MIEESGSGSRAGSGSGSIHLTSGSGSGRPKNMWIRWIRIRIWIRIHNTGWKEDRKANRTLNIVEIKVDRWIDFSRIVIFQILSSLLSLFNCCQVLLASNRAFTMLSPPVLNYICTIQDSYLDSNPGFESRFESRSGTWQQPPSVLRIRNKSFGSGVWSGSSLQLVLNPNPGFESRSKMFILVPHRIRIRPKAGSGSRSIRQKHGSADPDRHPNVMDPQHWYKSWSFSSRTKTKQYKKKHLW